jgi:translation initiation factor 4G
LGNVRFIGELYKKGLLTEKIMHVCIVKLLGGEAIPHEEDLEALCKLLTTIGTMIDHPRSKEHMNVSQRPCVSVVGF